MRSMIVAVAIASLAIAARAEARGFQLGPKFAISAPTGDFGDALIPGIDAGITVDFMEKPTAGVGVDLCYHRWSASQDANASVDAFLSSLSGTTITGSKGTVTAVQTTLHVKLMPPVSGPIVPWVQVGMGAYRVNRILELPEAQLRAAGWEVQYRAGDDVTYELGYVGDIGFDTDTRMRFGLDASYHFLPEQTLRTNVTAFTIGVHMLFGSR